ncbi:HCL010Cp [Eremothecium sinecaudum]|uniref:HCL010Cp n=1 Tax=Eremothecium sinecaudum TaxID=45286 RepID=A0A0X8HQK2_9SACH|nr:HCL010Cp [Eremothecium sinecaudum]AMD20141.1 HCL010Cp [Eremothecium sinecaudum]
MSLRGLKALPVSRGLAEVACPSIRVASLPCLSTRLMPTTTIRTVHKTARNDSTTLFSSEKKLSSFKTMTLTSLKNECRSRGLKVSGKKSELLDRLAAFEAHMLYNTKPKFPDGNFLDSKRSLHSGASMNANAKQAVDKVHMPNVKDITDASELENDYIVKIPRLESNILKKTESKGFSKNNKSVGEDNLSVFGREGTVLTANTDLKIETPGDSNCKVEIVNEEAEIQNDPSGMDYTNSKYNSKTNNEQDSDYYNEPTDLSSRDKKLLGGFAAAVAFWWYLGRDNKTPHTRITPKKQH